VSAILVSPFSNSDIRDWPSGHYRRLIGTLVARTDPSVPVRLIGAKGQVLPAADIVRGFAPDRVTNDCGRLSWRELVDAVRSAACVIGNNSGIAHLAGHHRVPTVCVFGGAHQRIEWRPLGFEVATLTRTIACAPCQLHHAADCPYDLACLRRIDPAEVADVALALIGDRRPEVLRRPDADPSFALQEVMPDA
jgi:ADP-heptose:LPS heptosyltransferase